MATDTTTTPISRFDAEGQLLYTADGQPLPLSDDHFWSECGECDGYGYPWYNDDCISGFFDTDRPCGRCRGTGATDEYA